MPDRGRPAAIYARDGVENASRPNETHLSGTLTTLPDLLEISRPDGPTLVLIEGVVSLALIVRKAALLAV